MLQIVHFNSIRRKVFKIYCHIYVFENIQYSSYTLYVSVKQINVEERVVEVLQYKMFSLSVPIRLEW